VRKGIEKKPAGRDIDIEAEQTTYMCMDLLEQA
jgi:hypothetical protein